MIKQFLPSLSCLEVYFVLYIKLQEYRTDSFLLPLQVVVQRAPSEKRENESDAQPQYSGLANSTLGMKPQCLPDPIYGKRSLPNVFP